MQIEDYSQGQKTIVTDYWSEHTVTHPKFENGKESFKYLDQRSKWYPLFHELMDIWGEHTDQIVLDFGCGPANDLVGFLAHSKAKQVIGVDVSKKALTLAHQRLLLHENDFDLSRVKLIRNSEVIPYIPIEDKSVDYIYCEGVLHHTTNPLEILKEFNRILKDQGEICIMVYNYNSLYRNLYIAYERQILLGIDDSFTVDEACSRATDGENCPISRFYDYKDFLALCEKAGFAGKFLGGYFRSNELDLYKNMKEQALVDPRLAQEHKEFLKLCSLDSRNFPLYNGYYCGIGGVYKIHKKK